MEKEIVLKMTEIVKTFPGVKALNGAQLNIYRGRVMAVLGENGAGKSTLVYIRWTVEIFIWEMKK